MVNGKKLRSMFLILFIIAYVGSIVGAWMLHQFIMVGALVGCGLSIGIGEIVSLCISGKTLSTNITNAWKIGKWKSFWAYFMCISLILCMSFLMAHFFPWENVFR